MLAQLRLEHPWTNMNGVCRSTFTKTNREDTEREAEREREKEEEREREGERERARERERDKERKGERANNTEENNPNRGTGDKIAERMKLLTQSNWFSYWPECSIILCQTCSALTATHRMKSHGIRPLHCEIETCQPSKDKTNKRKQRKILKLTPNFESCKAALVK